MHELQITTTTRCMQGVYLHRKGLCAGLTASVGCLPASGLTWAPATDLSIILTADCRSKCKCNAHKCFECTDKRADQGWQACHEAGRTVCVFACFDHDSSTLARLQALEKPKRFLSRMLAW